MRKRIWLMVIINTIIFFTAICTNAATNNKDIPAYWQAIGAPTGGSVGALLFLPATHNTVKKILALGTDGIFASEDYGQTWQIVRSGIGCEPLHIGTARCYLVLDKNNTIYTGTSVGVYYSNDKGKTWDAPKQDSPIYGKDIIALTANVNGIYAGAPEGVYIYNYQKQTWVSPTPGELYPFKIVADPKIQKVYALDFINDVYYLANLRNRWLSMGFDGSISIYGQMLLEPNRLVVGGTDGNINSYYYDTGVWQQESMGVGSGAFTSKLFMRPDKAYSYYGFSNGALARHNLSNQKTVLWKHFVPSGILDLMSNGNAIYAATNNGIYTSVDDPTSDQEWILGDNTINHMFFMLAKDNRSIYAGSYLDGIFIASLNNEKHSWSKPIADVKSVHLAAPPLIKNDYFYLLAYDRLLDEDRIYFSHEGINWKFYTLRPLQRRMEPYNQKDINILQNITLVADNKGTIFTLIDGMHDYYNVLFWSQDHGKSWRSSDMAGAFPGYQPYLLTADKANNVYVGAYLSPIPPYMPYIYSTNNGGNSWSEPIAVAEGWDVLAAMGVDDKNRLYALGGSRSASENIKVEVAVKNGTNWVKVCNLPSLLSPKWAGLILNPLHTSFYSYIISPLGDAAIYHYDGSTCKPVDTKGTGTDALLDVKLVLDPITEDLYLLKLYRNAPSMISYALYIISDHGKTSWQIHQFDAQYPYDVIVDPATGYIYVSTLLQGVYVSKDHGRSWNLENDGLNIMRVHYFTLDDNNNIYAATFGGDIFKRAWHRQLK